MQRQSIIIWLAAFIGSLVTYLYAYLLLLQDEYIGLAYMIVSALFVILYIAGFVLAAWIGHSGAIPRAGDSYPVDHATGEIEPLASSSAPILIVTSMPLLGYMSLQGLAFLVSSLFIYNPSVVIVLNFLRILPAVTAYAINRVLPLTTNKSVAFISALAVLTLTVILWGSRLLMVDLGTQSSSLFLIFLWPALELLIGISVAFFSRLGTRHAIAYMKAGKK